MCVFEKERQIVQRKVNKKKRNLNPIKNIFIFVDSQSDLIYKWRHQSTLQQLFEAAILNQGPKLFFLSESFCDKMVFNVGFSQSHPN